ncbi:Protein tyrosine phosphatase type IVA 1 [Kappamyces sp. JEL0829]|nr:Protein tyrosine phosphatase type IVA 1 [Kappamyces sp. JEL0829]
MLHTPGLHSHALIQHPTYLGPLSFLISDCPTADGLGEFVALQQLHSSHHIIRISKPTYDKTLLEQNGIAVHEFYFEDGSVPPQDLVDEYFALLDSIKASAADGKAVVGIHCVSGIGRAPLLVCLALVDGGMDRLDAVEYIRKHRRGAINNKQLAWISDKKNGKRSKKKSGLFTKLFGKK